MAMLIARLFDLFGGSLFAAARWFFFHGLPSSELGRQGDESQWLSCHQAFRTSLVCSSAWRTPEQSAPGLVDVLPM
jgi:hypothetical protein